MSKYDQRLFNTKIRFDEELLGTILPMLIQQFLHIMWLCGWVKYFGFEKLLGHPLHNCFMAFMGADGFEFHDTDGGKEKPIAAGRPTGTPPSATQNEIEDAKYLKIGSTINSLKPLGMDFRFKMSMHLFSPSTFPLPLLCIHNFPKVLTHTLAISIALGDVAPSLRILNKLPSLSTFPSKLGRVQPQR